MFAALALATVLASHPCPDGDSVRASLLPLAIQNKLQAHNIAPDNFELDVPEEVGHDIVKLRKALDIATQAFFRCEVGSDNNPASIQIRLARFLHTNQSIRDDKGSETDRPYGANLSIRVKSVQGFRQSLFVILTFGVNCGDDNLLFLFAKSEGQWLQSLHWYSDRFTKPSDAFGDLYLYSAVPGQAGVPLVAIAHGHPWCTSRWSSFEINLLRPATQLTSQIMLGHFSTGYDRGMEEGQGIKPTTDGFMFNFWTNEAASAKDPTQMSGPLTLKFRTVTNSLECISKACPKK